MTAAAQQVRHLVGADWTDSVDGAVFETRDQHDGSLLGTVARGGAADGERAITAARTAFDEGPWPSMKCSIVVVMPSPAPNGRTARRPRR